MKLLIFLLFLTIFLLTTGGHLDVWDGPGYFFLTESLVLHNELMLYYDSPSVKEIEFPIDDYYRWQYQIKYDTNEIPDEKPPIFVWSSPLLSYLGVPFYVLAQFLQFSAIKLTAYFLNSIILSLTCTLVYTFSLKLYNSKKIAFVLALTAGVCSFAWPYITSMFQQPLTGLMIISSIYFVYLSTKNKSVIYPILSGLFAGLIVFAHSGTVIVVPGIVAVAIYLLLKEKKKILYYFSGLIPIAALQMYFNWFRFGSVTDFGYGHLQGLENHNSFEGVIGMIFSPGFGLIVNFPLFVLFPVALYYLWKKDKPLTVLFGYIFVSAWIFFGTQPDPIWSGLGAWGPRYMVPIIPIMVIPLGMLIQKFSHKISFKILFTGLAVLGFYVNLLGVLVWYQLGYTYAWRIQRIVDFPEENYTYFQWYFEHIPVVLHWHVLTTDYWEGVGMIYGWKTCIPDNFLYCEMGFVPIVIGISIMIILVAFVLKKLEVLKLKSA